VHLVQRHNARCPVSRHLGRVMGTTEQRVGGGRE
jgi:hypothetical protein